jgi:hypothetical protein
MLGPRAVTQSQEARERCQGAVARQAGPVQQSIQLMPVTQPDPVCKPIGGFVAIRRSENCSDHGRC